MTEYYADPLVTLLHGDCIEVMATLPADSVDAVVTDPPYGLEFMGKEWDSLAVGKRMAPRKAITAGEPEPGNPWASERSSYGTPSRNPRCKTCGKQKFNHPKSKCVCEVPQWDVEGWHHNYRMQAWHEAWGREALRVTKPGGYLLAFGGTRTHHRLVCALEDAGWIIRDELDWIYASGFPKGKANLKPAHEPIVLARKPGPLRPLAIDECRIGTSETLRNRGPNGGIGAWRALEGRTDVPDSPVFDQNPAGRWPSNVLLSNPELFDEPNPYVVGSGATATSGELKPYHENHQNPSSYGLDRDKTYTSPPDSGGYSRFFIVPKADRAERERGLAPGEKVWSDGREKAADYPSQRGATARANVHPTVKPIDLMRHLVRLVTPAGGVVLDPFLGSGTTALAASELGLKCIGIEREAEYLDIAKGRLIATPIGLGLDDGFNMEVGA